MIVKTSSIEMPLPLGRTNPHYLIQIQFTLGNTEEKETNVGCDMGR